jgi:hypothetical protein
MGDERSNLGLSCFTLGKEDPVPTGWVPLLVWCLWEEKNLSALHNRALHGPTHNLATNNNITVNNLVSQEQH